MNIKNKIYFHKRLKLILDVNENEAQTIVENSKEVLHEKELKVHTHIATILKNLEAYGYTLSEEIIEILKNQQIEFLEKWYVDTIDEIKETVGMRNEFKVMYPNFPKQVMEADDVEIYINAVIHYWSNGLILPEYEKEERFPIMIENPNLKVIKLGNNEDFNSIFTNLLSSKCSISKDDKEIIKWFVVVYNKAVISLIPEKIYHKEILSYFTNVMLENCTCAVEGLKKFYKTATDCLRLAVALSNGDVSLKEKIKFKNFTSRERKLILGLLENCKGLEEDMYRYKGIWKVLGKALHVSSYKKYKNVNIAFKNLRSDCKVETYRSKLVAAYEKSDLDSLIKLLSNRPGEFARNMDRLLRTFTSESEQEALTTAFDKVASKVATPILLHLHKYFITRINNKDLRVFYPKGDMAKSYAIKDELATIDDRTCKLMENICKKALIGELTKKKALGNVYIDEELKRFTVPSSLRSSSRALRTVGRGTRFPIRDDTNIIRTFLYWKEPSNYNDSIDLDLGAVFYNEDFHIKHQLNWQTSGLKIKKLNCVHSGDITSAPNGAVECIDIDLDKLRKSNISYVGLVINSYSDIPFSIMDDCFMGYMERNESNSGEIFEPLTVKHKVDLSLNSKMVMAMIVDVNNKNIIWSELAIENNNTNFNSITTNSYRIAIGAKSILNTEKPTIYDLAMLNARARANNIVSDISKADTIFSLDDGITPYDTDIILSELL